MSKTQTRNLVGFELFSAYIVEAGLDEEMRAVCLSHRVTLREVYLDARGTSVHSARLEIWWRLVNMGKSTSEIGRMFARDATSVSHAMRRLNEVAAEIPTTLGAENVNEVARAVAAGNLKKWKTAGQVVAAISNAKKDT